MSQQQRVFADYETGLLVCFEEEISGIAYFAGLAQFHGGKARQALLLLSEIEALTAWALHPLVERRGLKVRERAELMKEGQREAETRSATPWRELVAEWADDFPAYVDEIAQIASLAPAEDREGMDVLLDHEVAAVEFARLEATQDSDSLVPLGAFLTAHGAT